MSKWIKFCRPRKSPSGKTKVWSVLSFDGSELGEISWFGRWRKYAFHPAVYTVFEQDCLRKIAGFCEDESKKLRQQWKKRRADAAPQLQKEV